MLSKTIEIGGMFYNFSVRNRDLKTLYVAKFSGKNLLAILPILTTSAKKFNILKQIQDLVFT